MHAAIDDSALCEVVFKKRAGGQPGGVGFGDHAVVIDVHQAGGGLQAGTQANRSIQGRTHRDGHAALRDLAGHPAELIHAPEWRHLEHGHVTRPCVGNLLDRCDRIRALTNGLVGRNPHKQSPPHEALAHLRQFGDGAAGLLYVIQRAIGGEGFHNLQGLPDGPAAVGIHADLRGTNPLVRIPLPNCADALNVLAHAGGRIVGQGVLLRDLDLHGGAAGITLHELADDPRLGVYVHCRDGRVDGNPFVGGG